MPDAFHQKTRYDAILIGAGPTGIAAAYEFKNAGIKYLHLESGRLAQTIFNYPKNVHLFSHRCYLQIGNVHFPGKPHEAPAREEYLDYLGKVVSQQGLKVQLHSAVVELVPGNLNHCVRYRKKDGTITEVYSQNVIFAGGGYYKPRLLGIPGEDMPHVHHYFRTDLPVKNKKVLVVGGRNSAIEASTTLAGQKAEVLLSYRGSRLPRSKIKPWILTPFDEARKSGFIRIHYRTFLRSIKKKQVILRLDETEDIAIDTDVIFLLTGYGPDYSLLKTASVPFHKRTQRPLFNSKTLETKIPGIFLCGTLILTWKGKKASIENTLEHGKIILSNLR
ncbi:MAG: hypothetical protein FJ264_02630 [Planctomycetes bacterium]|nr:hypothetical protein [Planctomycetota bacterium]